MCHSLQRLPTTTDKLSPCRQHPRHAVTWWRHHRHQKAPVASVSTMSICSTSLERSSSTCRKRKALSDVTNTQQGDNRLSAANDLLITLDSGISFKAREALKRSFTDQGLDVWAPTRVVKRLKAELCEAVIFHWMGSGETRALVCIDVRAMIEGQLQDLVNSGRLKLHQQFVSQIVLVLTGDKGGDGVAATTKLGLVIGNVEHPNSPKNLSILGIYFGNDDRTNLENKFGSIFAQLNQLKTVSLEIAGRKRTIQIQIPQIHFGTDGTPRFCSDFSLSTLHSSEEPIDGQNCGCPPVASPTPKFVHWQQLETIDAARYPVRPKLHLLAAHVVPFARTHLWWGLISEQGMEHMHRMCNNLVGRYAHLGTPEKVVEKLVNHTTLLNALHDRGVENNQENGSKYPNF
ncbi:hypothetical protein niasHT_011174 [Heterodera trifolii]|uniref:Uncharacterized protein n=1 Tax=Heterodera trifolii TaxID=157864 RepID=A0ABD2KVK6_9BILA